MVSAPDVKTWKLYLKALTAASVSLSLPPARILVSYSGQSASKLMANGIQNQRPRQLSRACDLFATRLGPNQRSKRDIIQACIDRAWALPYNIIFRNPRTYGMVLISGYSAIQASGSLPIACYRCDSGISTTDFPASGCSKLPPFSQLLANASRNSSRVQSQRKLCRSSASLPGLVQLRLD